MPPHPPPPIPPAFIRKKETILASLSTPSETYTDASPKGSVDTAIRGLIERLNGIEGLVTTSSCAGRVSVFVEGRKGGGKGRKGIKGKRVGRGAMQTGGSHEEGFEQDLGEDERGGYAGREQAAGEMLQDEDMDDGQEIILEDVEGSGQGRTDTFEAKERSKGVERTAVPGGKGNGGRWLFVSHEPLSETHLKGDVGELLGLPNRDAKQSSSGVKVEMKGLRLVRFQFEPMILHIMTASLYHAQKILGAAINAGFRESGVQSLKNLNDTSAFPMIAVRSSGLAFESLVGYVKETGAKEDVIQWLVDEEYLRLLVEIANGRFVTNTERKERFENLLARNESRHHKVEKPERQAQKKAEGLKRQAAINENASEREKDDEAELLDCLRSLSDDDRSQVLV